jgi:hypothetical protein
MCVCVCVRTGVSPLTSSILIGQVGEPPYIPQTHSIANHRQHVLPLIGPVPSVNILIIAAHMGVLLLLLMVILNLYHRQITQART